MESHHNSSRKYFLKLCLSHEPLETAVKNLLGHAPFYPLHLTLTTIHLASDRPALFDAVAKSIAVWNPGLPDELDIDNARLEVMGETHVKFLSLCFSCSNLDRPGLMENLCAHLSRELQLERRTAAVNGRMECELLDAEKTPLIRIPVGEKKTHVSVLSTNDMKKNKALYKSYSKDHAVLLRLIDLSVITTTLFRVESTLFT